MGLVSGTIRGGIALEIHPLAVKGGDFEGSDFCAGWAQNGARPFLTLGELQPAEGFS